MPGTETLAWGLLSPFPDLFHVAFPVLGDDDWLGGRKPRNFTAGHSQGINKQGSLHSWVVWTSPKSPVCAPNPTQTLDFLPIPMLILREEEIIASPSQQEQLDPRLCPAPQIPLLKLQDGILGRELDKVGQVCILGRRSCRTELF